MPPRRKRARQTPNNNVTLPLSQVPEAAVPATQTHQEDQEIIQTTQDAMDMVENLVILRPASKVRNRRLNQNRRALLSTGTVENENSPILESEAVNETPRTKRKRLDRQRKREKRAKDAVREAENASQRERQRLLRADPNFREAESERQRQLRAEPIFRETENERQRQLRADPVFREAEKAAQAGRQRQLRADPEYREAELLALQVTRFLFPLLAKSNFFFKLFLLTGSTQSTLRA